MYKGLAKIAEVGQKMYQSSVAMPLAVAALGATIGGCTYLIQPVDHKLSSWKGLPTVQKYDSNLARTIAQRDDTYIASRDLAAYCAQDEKKDALCQDLVKNGHAKVTADVVKVFGVAAAIVIIHGITAGSSGGAAAVVSKKGGS